MALIWGPLSGGRSRMIAGLSLTSASSNDSVRGSGASANRPLWRGAQVAGACGV
jgi:hypothetical protein